MTIKSEGQNHYPALGGAHWDITSPWRLFSTPPRNERLTTGGTVSIAAMTVSTVRPVIFCNLHRGPAVAAGRLVAALGDLPGATLYPDGGEGDAGAAREGRSRRYSSAQPLRSRRRQPRFRWNTPACARAKPAGPEPFSRLFRYRAQSPSFPSRQ